MNDCFWPALFCDEYFTLYYMTFLPIFLFLLDERLQKEKGGWND